MTARLRKINKKIKRIQNETVSLFVKCSSVIIIALAALCIISLVRFKISKSVDERVCTELESTSWLQASILRSQIMEQYDPLITAANLLKNGASFEDENLRPAFRAIVETHELQMLGFADLNGDVMSYEGKMLGNICNRSYFRRILNGTSTRACEYLTSTIVTNKPRVAFAVPAYNTDHELQGVLVIVKAVDVLGRALFEDDDIFGYASSYFICNSEGTIITASSDLYKNDIIPDSSESIFEADPVFKDIYKENGKCHKLTINGKKYNVSLTPLRLNNWKVGCIVDSDVAAAACSASVDIIQQLTLEALGIILIVAAYIFFINYYINYHKRREVKLVKRYNDNYQTLLHEMDCTIAEYDTEKAEFELIEDSSKIFDLERLADGNRGQAYVKYQAEHPEFDFGELRKTAELAMAEKKPQSFESVLITADKITHWLKVILVPILSDKKITKVLAATIDVTGLHEDFDKMATTFSEIPGGIHRCYLSDPIHLEYYSEGLCKMVGYTHDEVAEIVGKDMNYCMLIHPDDRDAFVDFCVSIAASGGKQTIEYRMLCKDGSLINVSDTMDAKLSSSGIMYGYSVVTDLNKYKKMQEQLEKELAETKDHLEDLKIKNFTSQMQPHFLYNALASIREIVLDDPEYASELICDFTTYLRACIKSVSSDSLITLSQELDNIDAYVRIEKMRFGERFSVRYECDEKGFFIIPLSIQPLVENAIRHGVYERGKDGGVVIVRSVRKEDCIDVIVEDNGVGFDYETTMNEIKAGTRDSTGMFNLIYRFDKILHAKVKVESKINVGTRITVSIPIIKKMGGETLDESNSGR